jgi:hypothetical protein
MENDETPGKTINEWKAAIVLKLTPSGPGLMDKFACGQSEATLLENGRLMPNSAKTLPGTSSLVPSDERLIDVTPDQRFSGKRQTSGASAMLAPRVR